MRKVESQRPPDARSGTCDDCNLVEKMGHARAPCVWAETVSVSDCPVVRYASRSKRLVCLRKAKVKSGHKVVLLPCASRYQLAQPPVIHTVGASFRCSSAL